MHRKAFFIAFFCWCLIIVLSYEFIFKEFLILSYFSTRVQKTFFIKPKPKVKTPSNPNNFKMSLYETKPQDIKDMFDFEELLRATSSKNPSVRKRALKEFCPCHVKKDIDRVW